MQKVKFNLPMKVTADDYHDFPYLQEQFRKIIPGIKIIEVGCIGDYIGMAYIGNINTKENKSFLDKLKTLVEEEEL